MMREKAELAIINIDAELVNVDERPGSKRSFSRLVHSSPQSSSEEENPPLRPSQADNTEFLPLWLSNTREDSLTILPSFVRGVATVVSTLPRNPPACRKVGGATQ